jgi:lipooligosaccharide transport system permease protein
MAYAATVSSGSSFNWVFRFVVTPLFLFSGVFFPITRLPRPFQIVAWGSPLFHGASLVRDHTLGSAQIGVALLHITYLVSVIAAGVILAMRTFERRLHP